MTQTTNVPSLDVSRVLNAPREKVFAAWTDPAAMQQWFAPPPATVPHAESDPRPGGRYVVQMQGPDGTQFTVRGKYLEVVRPERLVFTWSWDGPSPEETTVTVTLRSVTGGTEVTVRHERFTTDESRSKHAEGWNGCLDKLAAYVAA